MVSNLTKYSRINVSQLEEIKKFIGSESNPKFFITLTEINKIGINPKSKYNTPLGVFCYPLTKSIYEQLISNSLPFVREKPYINVFTTSQSIFNLENYTESDLNRDLNTIKLMYNETDDSLNPSISTAKDCKNIFASKFWNITRELSPGQSILKWNSLLRNLGYVGFYDPGMGLIHPAEPTQAVILDPSIIIPVESFLNPYGQPVYSDPYLYYMPHGGKKESVQIKEDSNIIDQRWKKNYQSSSFERLNHNELLNIAKKTNSYKNLMTLVQYNDVTAPILLEILNRLEEPLASAENKLALIMIILKNYAADNYVEQLALEKIKKLIKKSDFLPQTLFELVHEPLIDSETLMAIIEKTDIIGLLTEVSRSPMANDKVLQMASAKLNQILDKEEDKDSLMNAAQSPLADETVLQKIIDKANFSDVKDNVNLFTMVACNKNAGENILKIISSKLEEIIKNKENKLSSLQLKNIVSCPLVSEDILQHAIDRISTVSQAGIIPIVISKSNTNEGTRHAALVKLKQILDQYLDPTDPFIDPIDREMMDSILNNIVNTESVTVGMLRLIMLRANRTDVKNNAMQRLQQMQTKKHEALNPKEGLIAKDANYKIDFIYKKSSKFLFLATGSS